MKDYTAVVEFHPETEETLIKWGRGGSYPAGEVMLKDEREIHRKIMSLNYEGWEVKIESHSYPNISVNGYASSGGGLPHCPEHRYDCDRCKFAWNCGLACGCNLSRKDYPEPPERVKLNRLRAFLELDDHFIKDRASLERYIEGIWKDD